MVLDQGPIVEVAHAFGSLCGSLRREAVLFGDEVGDYLTYPVGRRMAFRRLDTSEMNLVVESNHVEDVTACTVSRDRRLLAVCESCSAEPCTQVSVYDLQAVGTRPAQTLEELGGAVGKIVCACFSPDEAATLLCFASVGTDLFLLVLLDWRRNLVRGRAELASPVDQVGINPLDPDMVSISSDTVMQLWVAEEGELQDLPPFEGLDDDSPATFTDHAWVSPADGTLIACTAQGPLYVLSCKDMQVVFTIEQPFEAVLENMAPLCIRCFNLGFVVGGSAGTIAVWELEPPMADDDVEEVTDRFTHVRTACVRHTEASVCCVDTVDVEGQIKLVFGFEDANIGHQSMAMLLKGRDDLALCNVISGGFHAGPVTSVDIAAQRPIIASMSRQDCSVRIWNFQLRKCELCCTFSGEELTSVAIHPFGYFLAVSFTDKLRFFQILVNDLKSHRELSIRGIRLVKFSNGGHLLAVATGKLVIVLSTRTLAKVCTLRGHSQHVTSLCFDPKDHVLLTCGEDGALLEWSTQTWQKVHEHIVRSSECLAITAGDNGVSCCCCLEGSRSVLHTFKHCVQQDGADGEVELPGHLRLGALSYHDVADGAAVLLAGTSLGALWVATAPFSLDTLEEHGLHTGPCLAVCLSADCRTIVTAGEDGSIFVLKAEGFSSVDQSASGSRPLQSMFGKEAATEVVMINRGEIQVRQEEFQLLNAENTALQARLAEEAAKLEGKCRECVGDARQKDQREIESLRQEYESLQQTATTKERESLRVMKTIETAHVQEADKLEAENNKRITQQAERFITVEAELKQLEKRIEVLREDSQAQLEQVRFILQEDLRRQVSEKEAEIQKLKDLLAFAQHRFDTMLDQEGMEYDLEVSELKRGSQDELEKQRLIEYTLKKEQDGLLRGLDMMERDRERITKEQEETRKTIDGLTSEMVNLNKGVKDMKDERRDREATLRDKELQIGSYKVKVNTLKKFKQVLDFRLREVQRSLLPKDRMIGELNKSVMELEAEFERQLEVQHTMERTLEQKGEQISKLAAEGDKLRDVIRQRERTIERFNTDLHAMVTNEQDVRRWPQALKQIYREHVNPKKLNKNDDIIVPMEELRRQTKLMEKKVSLLAGNQSHTAVSCRQDIQQKTTENSLLIHELNLLRVDRQTLQRQVKDMELRVHQAQHKAAELKSLPAPLPPKPIEDSQVITRTPSDGVLQTVRTTAPSPQARLLTSGTGHGFVPEISRALSAKATREVTARAPLHPTSKGKRSTSHVPPQERKRMQQLLAKADLNGQQIQMQALENKILRDQVSKLLWERDQRQSLSSSTAGRGFRPASAGHSAGSGLAAVRHGATAGSASAETTQEIFVS